MHMEAAQESAARLRREVESVESLQVEAASLQLQNYSGLNQKDEELEAKQSYFRSQRRCTEILFQHQVIIRDFY